MISQRSSKSHFPKKHNIFVRDTKNFDRENFILDIIDTDWNTLYCNDVNTSFNNFLDRINNLLDKYMPLKKLSKKEFKQQYKPWITNGILKSIERKNKIYKSYTKTKNNEARTQIYSEYKILRNTLTNLIKVV